MAEIAAAAGVSRATFHRAFRSRAELRSRLALDPEAGSRERLLAAATEMLAETTLGALSMDELAERAGLSRATLYRLVPGKAGLLRELVRKHSPMQAVTDLMAEAAGRPPDEVMPELARTLARATRERGGLIRTLLVEITGPGPDADLARDFVVGSGLAAVLGYIVRQVAAGRIRPVHPLVAAQAFIGPLLFHLLTRSVAESRLGFDVPFESVAVEMAEAWVRAFAAGGERDAG